MFWLRRYIAPWLLSLLIVLTGQAAAMAHAAPAPGGQVELCTGDQGPVMVYLDEDGQPTGPPVYCPDFALSLILALADQPVICGLCRAGVDRVSGVFLSGTVVTRGVPVPPARGPPV